MTEQSLSRDKLPPGRSIGSPEKRWTNKLRAVSSQHWQKSRIAYMREGNENITHIEFHSVSIKRAVNCLYNLYTWGKEG